MPESANLKEPFPRTDATCSQCSQPKRPTKAYLAMLKHHNLPYVCQACRESAPIAPIDLHKLGAL